MIDFDSLIYQWLRAHPEDRDISQGAMLLLKADRNKIFYNAATSNPQKYADRIEEKLRAYLRRKKQTPTPDQAKAMASTILSIRQDRQPQTDLSGSRPDAEAQKSGLRPDHDSLPDEIKKIPLANRTIKAKMQIWHARIQELAATECQQECSRQEIAELVALLRDADIQYHDSWHQYDTYGVDKN